MQPRLYQVHDIDKRKQCLINILHRPSQDFVSGSTFLTQKSWRPFSRRRPQNTRWNYLNNVSHCPHLPNFLKNGLLLCLGCALSTWGVHLQLSPVNWPRKKFFLRPEGCICTQCTSWLRLWYPERFRAVPSMTHSWWVVHTSPCVYSCESRTLWALI